VRNNTGNSPLPLEISYNNGPKVIGTKYLLGEYTVNFIDKDSDSVVYSGKVANSTWTKAARAYYTPWRVDVTDADGNLILSDALDLRGKKVRIDLRTGALGDTLAWAPFAGLFADKHSCEVHCFCNHWSLFKARSAVHYAPLWSSTGVDYYATYGVGFFDKTQQDASPVPSKSVSLQGAAALILGLEPQEIRPELHTPLRVEPPTSKKYVCIGVQSTAQCKYWNNEKGWGQVVEYLNSKNYDVVCIDKFSSFGGRGKVNYIPSGVIDMTGSFSLDERISCLNACEFFIGLPSGLSWLAWAVGKPVILISGFSSPDTEFPTPYRVFNGSVCNSCWNDPSLTFDRGNWLWCPREKDFECSKTITFDMVQCKIDQLIN
jgi:autotransporter strand-loop-strand O-heptosyltransferase